MSGIKARFKRKLKRKPRKVAIFWRKVIRSYIVPWFRVKHYAILIEKYVFPLSRFSFYTECVKGFWGVLQTITYIDKTPKGEKVKGVSVILLIVIASTSVYSIYQTKKAYEFSVFQTAYANIIDPKSHSSLVSKLLKELLKIRDVDNLTIKDKIINLKLDGCEDSIFSFAFSIYNDVCRWKSFADVNFVSSSYLSDKLNFSEYILNFTHGSNAQFYNVSSAYLTASSYESKVIASQVNDSLVFFRPVFSSVTVDDLYSAHLSIYGVQRYETWEEYIASDSTFFSPSDFNSGEKIVEIVGKSQKELYNLRKYPDGTDSCIEFNGLPCSYGNFLSRKNDIDVYSVDKSIINLIEIYDADIHHVENSNINIRDFIPEKMRKYEIKFLSARELKNVYFGEDSTNTVSNDSSSSYFSGSNTRIDSRIIRIDNGENVTINTDISNSFLFISNSDVVINSNLKDTIVIVMGEESNLEIKSKLFDNVFLLSTENHHCDYYGSFNNKDNLIIAGDLNCGFGKEIDTNKLYSLLEYFSKTNKNVVGDGVLYKEESELYYSSFLKVLKLFPDYDKKKTRHYYSSFHISKPSIKEWPKKAVVK